MLKIYCLLTGDDYQIVKGETPASKRKIALLATCLFVPVIMWFINAVLLVHKVLLSPILVSVVSGFIVAFIVFLIEKAVIMSNGSKAMAVFRVSLGLMVALLGSVALDEVIFKSDIDQQVTINRDEMIQESIAKIRKINDSKIEKLNQEISSKLLAWEEWQKKAIDNAEGKNGMPYGHGEVAKMLEGMAKEKKDDYETTQLELSALNNSLKNEEASFQHKQVADFNDHSLLIRIKALWDLVAKNDLMMFVYLVFTLLLFLLEFLVVIIKLTSTETNYEKKVKIIEQIGSDRLNRIANKDQFFFDPGSCCSRVKVARTAIQKPSPAIFS